MDIRVRAKRVRFHRNGVAGAGFYTVEFRHGGRDMVAIVFPEHEEDERTWKPITEVRYAVIDTADPSYVWRGDLFFDGLAAAIDAWSGDGRAYNENGMTWTQAEKFYAKRNDRESLRSVRDHELMRCQRCGTVGHSRIDCIVDMRETAVRQRANA